MKKSISVDSAGTPQTPLAALISQQFPEHRIQAQARFFGLQPEQKRFVENAVSAALQEHFA